MFSFLAFISLENVDHVLREAEACPQLDEDFPDCLGVVRHAQRRLENLLNEVEVLGGDLHVQRLEGLVLRKRSPCNQSRHR